MKKIANILMPFAFIVLVATCLISIFSLLVILESSVGMMNDIPWRYYQRLNIGVISVALPVVGMLLFGVILLGLREKAAITKTTAPPVKEEEKEEERLKAAA